MAHTCNFYCQDGWHAAMILSKDDTPEATRAAYEQLGFEVKEVRPGREVDLAQVRAQMRMRIHETSDGRLERGPLTAEDQQDLQTFTHVYMVVLRRARAPQR